MLLLFKSTHDVIRAEKIFENNAIENKIIPVPRDISSECGMSIKINKKSIEKVLKLLKDIDFTIHKFENEKNEK